MARLGEAERSLSFKTIIGVLAILFSICVLGAMAFYYFKLSRAPELTADFCPADGPKAHLAILVDTTDPLTLTHIERTRQELNKKINDAGRGTRISFLTINPDSGVRDNAFFSICKPPSGNEASFLTKNPRMIQEKYEKEFKTPMDDTLDRLLTIPSAPASPIMEGLQEFASRIPDFSTTDQRCELIIVSDLIQHSESFSFYRGGTWNSFSDSGGPERFGFAFMGCSIIILRIPRAVEMAATVDDFWNRYLSAQGFRDIDFKIIGDL